MRYRPSLYLRLIVALLGPLLIGMVAAWAIGVGAVTSALEQRQERQLRIAARELATGALPYTPDLLRRLARLQQADFVLLDGAGGVVMSTSPNAAAAVQASLAARPLWTGSASRTLDSPVRSVAVYEPIDAPVDARYSALVAVAPLGDATAAAERAARWLGLAMLAAAAVLGAVVLALVRNITRPLGELSALADRIAAGERQQRIELPRADEIGALGESLNAMMLRLGSYESRLATSSRMSALGEMSARLAHEIRNPLTGLKLHLQLLAERIDEREAARVGRLLAEVQRLELLVSSTLLLGGTQPLAAVATDVRALIAEVLDLMAPSLSHRGVRAEMLCENGLEASVDRTRVRQALLNLVVNAADAMPHGGTLLIGAGREADGPRMLITVEDSGPGLPQEIAARVHDNPGSTKPFGLGLGLAVCRDVASAHGGELRVDRSPALGGARVTLALPLHASSSLNG